MLNLILGGAPGSGKGTISDIIVQNYGLTHISTGDVLRAEIASGSELGKEIDALISKGNLVPDDKMIAIINKFLDSLGVDCKGVIFDGFPRTVAQAEALTELLERRRMHITMLDLFATEETIIARLLNRGKTSGRADDNLETIQKRLAIYHEQTQPVAGYYLKRHQYFFINANINPDVTFAQVQTILELIDKH
ncbi:MAG: adenylate kinase [Paludibacteraceae bacterium]|nr:adenylate kinase [Paludibacteraceae bacterium]